ncbi:hypothetical protein SAMN04488523_103200 [Sulfitobacter brevis]|uniref:Uncharacterized protein n=1 Tax=Sulfitobacter brevis TaxID=74348 RepID=A0A1I1W3L6_9RHOB|nr:hypothetical protein [Sulfitobacter brevis]SFD87903.1 hypothetical protein SAMN04488523_103200 [Sulfitobacter brevis]
MKRTTSTMIAALLATGVSTAAFAESKAATSVDAGVTADVTANTGAANVDVTADTDANVKGKNKLAKENYGQLISELRSGSKKGADVTAEIGGVTADAETTFTTVSDLKGNAGDDAEALDNALDAKSEMVMDLQAALEANADLKSKIVAEGYKVDQVIAVSTQGSGGVTLVVDDRM